MIFSHFLQSSIPAETEDDERFPSFMESEKFVVTDLKKEPEGERDAETEKAVEDSVHFTERDDEQEKGRNLHNAKILEERSHAIPESESGEMDDDTLRPALTRAF